MGLPHPFQSGAAAISLKNFRHHALRPPSASTGNVCQQTIGAHSRTSRFAPFDEPCPYQLLGLIQSPLSDHVLQVRSRHQMPGTLQFSQVSFQQQRHVRHPYYSCLPQNIHHSVDNHMPCGLTSLIQLFDTFNYVFHCSVVCFELSEIKRWKMRSLNGSALAALLPLVRQPSAVSKLPSAACQPISTPSGHSFKLLKSFHKKSKKYLFVQALDPQDFMHEVQFYAIY